MLNYYISDKEFEIIENVTNVKNEDELIECVGYYKQLEIEVLYNTLLVTGYYPIVRSRLFSAIKILKSTTIGAWWYEND